MTADWGQLIDGLNLALEKGVLCVVVCLCEYLLVKYEVSMYVAYGKCVVLLGFNYMFGY